jgi:hypothetical protein
MTRPRGYRHGLRVRFLDGVRGVLLRCESRDGRTYWRVRLQTGAWRWPDGIAVEGPGDERHGRCGDCGLPFYTAAGSDEILCHRCDAELFGSAVRATEPDPPHPFDDIPAHRRRS